MVSFSHLLLLISSVAIDGFVSPSQSAHTTSWALHVGIRPGFASSTRRHEPLAAIAIEKPTRHANHRNRFERTASNIAHVDQPCILTIDGTSYNITAWAKSHPGGVRVLEKFHNKDASRAFHAADHSKAAYKMLSRFAISTESVSNDTVVLEAPIARDDAAVLDSTAIKTIRILEETYPTTSMSATGKCPVSVPRLKRKRPRWIQKLFTKEDPIGAHKFLGGFVLLHFAFRYSQMLFGDPSAGLGTRLGKGPSIVPALCLVPHGLLSLSSLIFHTVPRERVVGKPMIWQEYRVHNIAFGLRSVVTAFLAWLAIYHGNTPCWRRVAVIGCCLTACAANIIADEGTRRLRADAAESTTATMPYWEGCSLETQKRFKTFYAYSQFLATGACITVGNPAWSLAVLLAIQMASLLMTLVRKGLLSAKGYHVGYTISLALPYLVATRHTIFSQTLDFPVMAVGGWMLYQLRRRGVNKYALWLPVYAFRIAYGDRFINWQVW